MSGAEVLLVWINERPPRQGAEERCEPELKGSYALPYIASIFSAASSCISGRLAE